MDMEWMRSLMTIIAFATFIGIVLWAWSTRKRHDFEAAACSILAEDDADPGNRRSMTTRGGGDE